MLRNLKINTAIILFAAFAFRLLFIYAGSIYSYEGSQRLLVKSDPTSVYKKQIHFNESKNVADEEFLFSDIFSEDTDEDKHKLKVYPFRRLLYSLISIENGSELYQAGTIYESFSFIEKHLYLDIQVFRI